MAEEGSSTAHLDRTATEAQVQTALSWNDKGWPWSAYGPAVMAAVRAGVPVLGANLPRARMKDAMADVLARRASSDADSAPGPAGGRARAATATCCPSRRSCR